MCRKSGARQTRWPISIGGGGIPARGWENDFCSPRFRPFQVECVSAAFLTPRAAAPRTNHTRNDLRRPLRDELPISVGPRRDLLRRGAAVGEAQAMTANLSLRLKVLVASLLPGRPPFVVVTRTGTRRRAR